MKNNSLKVVFGSVLACIAGASVISVGIVKERIAPAVAYSNGDGDTYYNGIPDNLTGDELLSELQKLNNSRRKSTVGYNAMGTSDDGKFKYTDYDPRYIAYDENGQVYGTKRISFYSGNSSADVGGTWNREHVWPNSHGGNKVENDIHMPRPTLEDENGKRGNSFYVTGLCSGTYGWDPAEESFGLESYRGDSARIIFYCVVANSNLSLIDEAYHQTSKDNNDDLMGKLSDMLQWNLDNPVDPREQRRNEGAEYLQGNRNPFIDHPEYACKIWGDTNADTRRICGSNVAPTSLSVSLGSSSIAVGATTKATVTVNSGASSSVTWSTSNSSVATVSKGTITGVSAGTATITATSTLDNSVYGSATITVKGVSSLAVSGTPTKTTYVSGESFNPAGLTVTATFTDSSTQNVTDNVVWTPSSLSLTTTSVTGTYGGKTVTVNGITVTAPAQSKDVIISGALQSTWTLNGTGSATSSNYYGFKSGESINSSLLNLEAGSSITYSFGVGTYGGYDATKSTITVGAYNSNGELVSNTQTITPGGKNTSSPGTQGNGTITLNAGVSECYIRFTTNGDASVYPRVYNLSVNYTEASTQTVAVTGVTLSDSSLSIYTGHDDELEATVSPSNATNKAVTWSSSNTNVATVANGLVTAVAAGSATITVTTLDGSYTASCSVTVNANSFDHIEINDAPTQFYVGGTFSSNGASVRAYYADGSYDDVTSSATFTGYNLSNAGTQTVTVSVQIGDVTKTTTYQITISADSLTGISTSGQTTSFVVGDTFTYDGVCTASYLSGGSNTVTPTVDSSLVDMSTAGTYTVTLSYTANGVTKTTSYNITVSSSDVEHYFTITKSNSGLTTSYSSASKSYEIETGKSVNVQWTNARNESSFDEFTLGSSSGSIVSDNSTLNITKIVIDSYNYYDVTVSANGVVVTGTELPSSENYKSHVYEYTINSNNWSIVNNTTYNRNIYSITLYSDLREITPEPKSLTSISLGTATTTYTVGDTFVEPSVTAHYSDNSTADISSSATFSGYNMGMAGKYTVLVSYTEDSITKTTEYSITVNAQTSGGGGGGASGWFLVENASELVAGDVVVFAPNSDSYDRVAAAQNNKLLNCADATFSSDRTKITSLSDSALQMTIGKSGSNYTFTSDSWSLSCSGVKSLQGTDVNTWTISITDGVATVNCTTSDYGKIMYNYNNGQDRFLNYTSNATDTQTLLRIYKYSTGGSSLTAEEEAANWAANFLNHLTCNQGVTAPSSSVWSEYASSYAELSAGAKTIIVSADYSITGVGAETIVTAVGSVSANVAQAVARYDYIINRYGTSTYNAFITGRTVKAASNTVSPISGDAVAVTATVLAFLTFTSFAVAYVMRKRKAEN